MSFASPVAIVRRNKHGGLSLRTMGCGLLLTLNSHCNQIWNVYFVRDNLVMQFVKMGYNTKLIFS